MNNAPIRRALLSVSDKTGLIEFGQFLAGIGVEILSTGGSAKALADAGVAVREVADLTGFPEIMDGRVKTLHPKVHGGLLGLRDDHASQMTAHDIVPIDLLAVNLYPFEATVAAGADFETCIENIDIGGPAMIRSAAKNHGFVTVIVSPDDYGPIMAAMKANDGATTLELRRKLAAKAYSRTGSYDAGISGWFSGQLGETFPERLVLAAEHKQTLRYGENPHQVAGFYVTDASLPGLASAEQAQGKDLSYNNLNDTDAAFELISEFPSSGIAAVAIIKHANPCGVATGPSLAEAYRRALACDPISAFGGVIALNKTLDAETAEEITKVFTEVIVAPSADDKAKEIIAGKKNLRLLLTGGLGDPAVQGMTMKSVAGGYLLQSRNNGIVSRENLKVVTKRHPTDAELDDLLFAFTVCKHVKSNAIVYVKDNATVGIGAGQMSRIDSARIAARKAEDAAQQARGAEPLTRGCAMASDAFFPFADGLMAAAEAGASVVIQPGGSIRDDEVIAAADEAGLAMVLTGMRHFRH